MSALAPKILAIEVPADRSQIAAISHNHFCGNPLQIQLTLLGGGDFTGCERITAELHNSMQPSGNALQAAETLDPSGTAASVTFLGSQLAYLPPAGQRVRTLWICVRAVWEDTVGSDGNERAETLALIRLLNRADGFSGQEAAEVDPSEIYASAGRVSDLEDRITAVEEGGGGGGGGSMTAAEILTAVKTVDGAGSGLDADLLDGQHAAYFATASDLITEASTRSAADTTLTSALASEVTARTAADTAINATLAAKADLVDGKVPSAQLPSYVDDVVEAADFASLPGTGEAGKIYVTLDDGLTYRWTGSVYAELGSGGVALGETSSTAYRGDRGKTAYDHTSLTNNPHNVTKSQVGLGNCDNTSDLNKPVSTATQAQINSTADATAQDAADALAAEAEAIRNEFAPLFDAGASVNASSHSLTSGTSAQSIFPSSQDAIYLAAGSYVMDLCISVTKSTTSCTIALGLAASGGGTIAGMRYTVTSRAGTVNTVGTPSTGEVNQAAATVVTSASSSSCTIYANGVVEISAGGYFTPQLTFSAAPGSPSLDPRSYVRFRRISNAAAS